MNATRAVAALINLDYPRYEVVVIDDNTDDERLWRPVEERCARHGVKFAHLEDWPGYKSGLGVIQPVPAADGPDQWGIPLDERVPCLLLVVSGALDQVGHRPVIAHLSCINGHDLGSPCSPRAVTVAVFTLADGRALHHEQRPHNAHIVVAAAG
jgi:cellulose synthase/poly-beta-1,6-N-acetylglucosamine synthase-like glycosyltransferase